LTDISRNEGLTLASERRHKEHRGPGGIREHVAQARRVYGRTHQLVGNDDAESTEVDRDTQA
jgi:hypothetical protein